MGILDERELTEAERAAIADESRPGVWLEITQNNDRTTYRRSNGDLLDAKIGPMRMTRGDGRVLTQHQTDVLIARELRAVGDASWDEITAAVGDHGPVRTESEGALAFQQRGGIHSDPLVRLLAFRAWGDRDRAWRKRDTARALIGDVLEPGGVDRLRSAYGFDGVSQWAATFTAQRGDRQATASVNERDMLRGNRPVIEHLLDAFDELDAKLTAGGEPLPSGPLTFDLRG